MAWVSYNSTTGTLVQISDYEIPLTNGLSVTQNALPKAALEVEYQWDEVLLDFVIKTSRRMARIDFLRRLTPQERIAIRELAKTDVIVFDAMELLNMADYVDVNDTDVIQMCGYFVYVNILTSARVLEILA